MLQTAHLPMNMPGIPERILGRIGAAATWLICWCGATTLAGGATLAFGGAIHGLLTGSGDAWLRAGTRGLTAGAITGAILGIVSLRDYLMEGDGEEHVEVRSAARMTPSANGCADKTQRTAGTKFNNRA